MKIHLSLLEPRMKLDQFRKLLEMMSIGMEMLRTMMSIGINMLRYAIMK
ncbi:hypothetical protein C5167_017059 [Papaver somniferum]|uniref:Uncharacterized protein n=1 Tax=Papaver somniferum TaxID=3469 RepID=A0A4Y7IME4_PAPSO|nr:hypothetical protein C5167_017059 [Papaver somniferum]